VSLRGGDHISPARALEFWFDAIRSSTPGAIGQLQEYYPALRAHLAAQGTALPGCFLNCFASRRHHERGIHKAKGARLDLSVPRVFAPNSKHRALVTKAARGKGAKSRVSDKEQEKTPVQRRAALSWAQRLKRVFGIDIETCPACGGAVRIIACIEDPVVIEKILTHLDAKATAAEAKNNIGLD
jgi:hypothetical protein